MRERSRRQQRTLPSERVARRRRLESILALACGASLAVGCSTERGADSLAERCLYVLEYRQPTLSEVDVIGTTRSAIETALTLHFEATAEPASEPVADYIFCSFEPEERWLLQRVVIGDRELSTAELALVNAELLLRDLVRNPQRLSRKEPQRPSGDERGRC